MEREERERERGIEQKRPRIRENGIQKERVKRSGSEEGKYNS